MEKLYELKDIMMDSLKEFDTIKEGRLKINELEALKAVTGTIKNVGDICTREEDRYSRDGWNGNMTPYFDGNSYNSDGRRGTRRGGNYSGRRRRDSMGRYSRDGAKESIIEDLREMLDTADNDRDREAIRRCMDEVQRA